ncbi:hypothetical protein SAMN05216312_107237 [Cohnella sp. OV330]|uniref:DUF6171 family protein n=1 Tax=Cohnella sp. OV330 TaxID=1855288 RepID=UPI0008E9AEB5|nr:DUF6171 family protein [Cohnella sp. OV330]SFB41358.1 hypothetical protein SAMN05216312_107237 [Cohnella sp. OV330]
MLLEGEGALGTGMSVKATETCKGCTSSVKVTEAQIERLLSKIKPSDRIDDDSYKTRLEACASCDGLAYGTTCMHCGCLVRLRASLKEGRCPHPESQVNPKWLA